MLSERVVAELRALVLIEDPDGDHVVLVDSGELVGDRLLLRVEAGGVTKLVTTWTLPRELVENRLPTTDTESSVQELRVVLTELYREGAGTHLPAAPAYPLPPSDPYGPYWPYGGGHGEAGAEASGQPSGQGQTGAPAGAQGQPAGPPPLPYDAGQRPFERIDQSGGPGDPDLDF